MGLATAQLLASRGAILSIADVNASALDAALKSLAPPSNGQKQHLSFVVDVSSSAQVNSWIEDTVAVLGPLDGAANIAGVLGREARIRDTTDQEWAFVEGVNAKGVFHCLRAQLNHIKEGGSIVNFASIASLVALPWVGPYTASKHAVLGLTKCAAREEGPRGIRVNAVAPGTYLKQHDQTGPHTADLFSSSPGMVKTPIVDHIAHEEILTRTERHQCINRIADPVELATVVAFLLGDESRFVTGACWKVDGGWTA